MSPDLEHRSEGCASLRGAAGERFVNIRFSGLEKPLRMQADKFLFRMPGYGANGAQNPSSATSDNAAYVSDGTIGI